MAVTADKCELWANKAWVIVGIDDVLKKYPSRKLRCVECWGAVRAHREGVDGHPAHFEHRESHVGCSLCMRHDGSSSRHPHPLI